MKKLLWHYYLVLDALRRSLLWTGWLRSLWTGQVRDRRRSIPWLTYPAIHFLDTLDLTRARVLEFGSGSSTLYWKRRVESGEVRSYLGLECSTEFHAEMAARDGFYRDHVRLYPEISDYLAAAGAASAIIPFDVTIVDGPYLTHKRRELEASLAVTDSSGLIIVDDTQWLSLEITAFCAAHHLFRLDFAGFAPAVSYSKVTSVLFRDPWRFTEPRFIQPAGTISCVHDHSGVFEGAFACTGGVR